MTRLASLLVVGIVAVIGAGCGSTDEQNNYVDQINALQTDLVNQVNEVVAGSPPANAQQAAAVAADLEKAFSASADDIEAVTPPDEVADLHDQLVTKIREIADQIAKARNAFENGNAQEAAAAAVDLQTATSQAQTDLNTLIDEINAEFQN
jgi:hypothetical protein